MTLLSRRFKLEYTDSNGDTQVMADTGQDGGDLLIDRHVHIRRKNDPDILKLRLEGTNFDQNVPTRKSEFGTAENNTDEPEILYKQYDPDNGTFVTRNRFYAKNTGNINKDGQLALKLYSFFKFTARQSVTTSNITTDIEDALNAVLPSGYVADVPSGATVPTVKNYSLNDRRERGYQELTRNYNFALTFTSNLDANNNYKVKFEPEGFGGSVDTLDKSTDSVLFKSWEKDKSESIVNKVKVEGTNSNGKSVVGQAKNQTQIDNFGEKFKKFKIGYVEDSTEADNIAEKYLVPGLNDDGTDITKVPEAGTVKTIVYSDNIVNDSINVIDSKRNIDDTFTVVQQRNFWPEGASELEFEFEQENLEEEARDSENLRDERARLLPSSTQDVGNQDVSATTEEQNPYDSFGGDNHNHSQPNETTEEAQGESDVVSDLVNIFTQYSEDQTATASTFAPSVDGSGFIVFAHATIKNRDAEGNTVTYDIEIEDSTNNLTLLPRQSIGALPEGTTKSVMGVTSSQNLDLGGDNIDFKITPTDIGSALDVDIEVDVEAFTIGGADFTIDMSNTDNGNTGGTNTANNSQLNASGSTEGNVNVNTAQEEKTNR